MAAPATAPETPAVVPPNPTPVAQDVKAPETPEAPPKVQPTWRDELGADIRDNPTIKGFGDDPKKAIPAMAKEVVDLKSMLGKKGVIVPGKDATQEQKDRFFNELGRPETPDKYDLSGFKPPEGVPWDDGFLQAIIPKLHARGASQELVQGLLGDYGDLIKGQWDQMQGQLETKAKEAEQGLRSEWGAAYGAKMELASRALKLGAGDDYDAIRQMRTADGVAFGDHPAVLRVLASFGDKLAKEHAFVGEKNARITQTPDEARLELAKIEAKGSPYWSREGGPEHDAMVKRAMELRELIAAK